MASEAMQQHYRQFLAGLILAILAGTGTVWWFTDLFLAVAYFGGASTVLIFTYAAPTYSPPDTDSEEQTERGFW